MIKLHHFPIVQKVWSFYESDLLVFTVKQNSFNLNSPTIPLLLLLLMSSMISVLYFKRWDKHSVFFCFISINILQKKLYAPARFELRSSVQLEDEHADHQTTSATTMALLCILIFDLTVFFWFVSLPYLFFQVHLKIDLSTFAVLLLLYLVRIAKPNPSITCDNRCAQRIKFRTRKGVKPIKVRINFVNSDYLKLHLSCLPKTTS